MGNFLSGDFCSNGFEKYKTQFDKHLTESVRLSHDKRIEKIASDVKSKVGPQPLLATSWTKEFKRYELPEVLAGLGAVWSLIVSKNGSSSEEMMKPSSLQIGYILSYFGYQNHNKDDSYKLLQISTRQGKELVLGLTAGLLALYGHKVHIVCLNSNLAKRNSIHLVELFQTFTIEHNISFESVEDMARERSREDYEKYATNIYDTIGIESNSTYGKHAGSASDDKRAVLLIDDIDIFLQKRIFGKEFKRVVRPTIPGLGLLQEKMFSSEKIRGHEIDQFMAQSDDPQITELRDFLGRTQSYKLLEGSSFEKKKYTNKILFNKHLKTFKEEQEKMVKDWFMFASDVDNLRISSKGVMVVKSLDEYDVYDDRNEIDYFRVKNSPFQQTVDGHKNYGYLSLGCIAFSYRCLLKRFPLILGFASAPLNGDDEAILRNYYDFFPKIAKSNSFRTIPVELNPKENFRYIGVTDPAHWMTAIRHAIYAAVDDRNCSVLVFFKNEKEMELFQGKFALLGKRVTAIKTTSNGKNLSEDEIAVDEVTVLAVEAEECNGQFPEDREVHVIQTFFSDDSREEDLIRRQAERSHGSGSYELIVNFIDFAVPYIGKNMQDEITYDSLAILRSSPTFEEYIKYLIKVEPFLDSLCIVGVLFCICLIFHKKK